MEPTTLGPTNRNARVAHIRKFVCIPPERGHVLRLITCEDPATVLGEWLRAACEDNGSTAEDVDGRLREHATTVTGEVIANLVWQTEAGLVVVTKRLKCRAEIDPANFDPALAAQAEALGLNGTRQGEDLQRQLHHERMMRSYFSAHQTQIGQGNSINAQAIQLVGILGTMLNEAHTNAHRAHIELDRMRSIQRRELDVAYDELREANSTDDDGRSDVMKQIGDALTTALPFMVQAIAKQLTSSEPSNEAPPAAAPKQKAG